MGRYVVGTGKRNRKLKEMEVREKEAYKNSFEQIAKTRGKPDYTRGSSLRNGKIRNST